MTYLLRFLDAQKDYYYIALRNEGRGKENPLDLVHFPSDEGLGAQP